MSTVEWRTMEIDAFLCDHAEVAEGKLFINGAGINVIWTGPEAPHVANLAVAAVTRVPWTATNEDHTIRVQLLDEDNNPVHPPTPNSLDQTPPIELTAGFNVGRPPQLPHGDSQTVPLAFGFNIPLPRLGVFVFVISIDGEEMKRLPFRMMVAQQQQPTFR
jgi:hypothetical protein